MSKALEHVRILDFTRALAGPFCTQKLAQFGAEVTKVEIPGEGDASRTNYPQSEGGESYLFIPANRGKRSITLNLASGRGREICKQLVEKADVVVENFSPGVMDRLGLGYDELSKVKPDLIYASLSGFGHTGPYSSRPAYDTVIQAMSGLMSVTGQPDGPPTMTGVSIADMCAGLYTAIAVLAALQHRWVTGEGQYIDMSMQDCMWDITSAQTVTTFFATGQAPVRKGNWSNIGSFGVYPTRDGNVVINAVTGGQWGNLVRVMGREDLLNDDRYADRAKRQENAEEVGAMVFNWTAQRTTEEIVSMLTEAHVPASPVPTWEQVASDPHLLSRGMVTEVEQVLSGRVKVPGSPFKLSKTPEDPTAPAPFLGQHNQEVYGGLLGYSEEQLAQLADEGVI